MKSEEYHQRMEETSAVVDKLLLDALEPFRDNFDLYNSVAELPLKKIGKRKVRAYFARSVYELCSEEKKKESESELWGPLAAAVEMEMCSMYYTNQFYDRKGGKESLEEIKKNVMAAKITRDLAQKLLESLKETKLNRGNLERIVELLNLSDMVVESGQFIDVFQNVYSVSGKLSFEEQIKLYERRTRKISASYFENIAEMSTELASVSDIKIIDALKKFGHHYGMLLQIVNDVADFVPVRKGTTEKLPEDVFSDIKHRKLTLPIIYTLHYGSKEDKKQFIRIMEKRENAKESELIELTRMLARSGSIGFVFKKVKEHKREAKKALRIFPKNKRKYLSDMCMIADSNKYYKALENIL